MKKKPEILSIILIATFAAALFWYFYKQVLGGDYWNWLIFSFYLILFAAVIFSIISKKKIDGLIISIIATCVTIIAVDILIVALKFDPFEIKIRKTTVPQLGVINVPKFHDTVDFSAQKNGDLLDIYKVNPKSLPELNTNESYTFSYNIDKLGFRNQDDRQIKDAQILTIGDSYTIASSLPLDKGWPYLIENLTQKKVYSAATNQIGPINYLRYLEYFAPQLAPNTTILIGFFEGNDFVDLDFTLPQNTQKNLANLLRYVWINRNSVVKNLDSIEIPQFKVGDTSWPILFYKAYVDQLLMDENTFTQRPQLKELAQILGKMKEICNTYQHNCAVVYFPDKFHVYFPIIKNQFNYQKYFAQILGSSSDISTNLAEKTISVQEKTFKKMVEAAGLKFISLTSALTQKAADSLLYWPYDSHLNGLGNQTSAEEIIKELEL